MPEMAGAVMICLTTTPTGLTIIQNTHTRIKEAPNARLSSIIRSRIGNLYHGPLLNLFRAKDAKLDANYWLDIRIRAMNSGWHLSSVL